MRKEKKDITIPDNPYRINFDLDAQYSLDDDDDDEYGYPRFPERFPPKSAPKRGIPKGLLLIIIVIVLIIIFIRL